MIAGSVWSPTRKLANQTSVMAEMSRSLDRMGVTTDDGSGPNPLVDKRASSKFHPYSAGCEIRLSRLVPNVRVATATTTASSAPIIVERTGTALRPRPGSMANRRPARPLGGRPEPAAQRSSTDRPLVSASRRATRWGACRSATRAAVHPITATNTSAPRPSTVQSAFQPRAGSTAPTGPKSVTGERRKAMAAEAIAPRTMTISSPISTSAKVATGDAPSERRTAASSPPTGSGG